MTVGLASLPQTILTFTRAQLMEDAARVWMTNGRIRSMCSPSLMQPGTLGWEESVRLKS